MIDTTIVIQGQSLALGQVLTALYFFCRSYKFQGYFYRLNTQEVFPRVYIFLRSKVIIDNLYFHLSRSSSNFKVQIS